SPSRVRNERAPEGARPLSVARRRRYLCTVHDGRSRCERELQTERHAAVRGGPRGGGDRRRSAGGGGVPRQRDAGGDQRLREAAGPAGLAGAAGARGPTGPKGDPGAGVSSIESLNGIPCGTGSAAGTIAVSYDSSAHVVLTCVPSGGGGGGGGTSTLVINEFM